MAENNLPDLVTDVAAKWGPFAGVVVGLLVTRAGRISDGIGALWTAYADRVRAHTEEIRSRSRRRDQESEARAERDRADADLAREAIRLRREATPDPGLRQSAVLDNVGGPRTRATRRTNGK